MPAGRLGNALFEDEGHRVDFELNASRYAAYFMRKGREERGERRDADDEG